MAISNRGEMGVGGGSRGGSGGGGSRPAPKMDRTSGGRGRVSVSTRSSELDKKTKATVKKQNKAADSYKIKDMDQLEKGQAYRAAKKASDARENKKALKKAETKGAIKGAAATVGLGSALKLATFTKEDKNKSNKKKSGK
jgi:hypothetical protein